jgi:hypothetical protein
VKPTEFGKLVKIQEAEAQFITDDEVCERRVPDQALWVPSLVRHEELFGRAPRLAVADSGFASRPMSGPRTSAGCGTWSCRGRAAKGARAPFEPPSHGGPAVKGASALSSGGTVSDAADIEASWVWSAGWASGSSRTTCWSWDERGLGQGDETQ